MSSSISSDYDVSYDDDDDYYDEEYERQLAAERQRREEEQRRLEEERRRQEELRCQQLDKEIAVVREQLAALKEALLPEAEGKIAEARGLFSTSYGIDITEKALSKIVSNFDSIPGSYMTRTSDVMAAHFQDLSRQQKNIVACRDGQYSEAIVIISKEIKDHKIAVGEKAFLAQTFAKGTKKAISLEATKKTARKDKTIAGNKELAVEIKKFFEVVSPYLQNPFALNRNEIAKQVAAVEELIASVKVDGQYKAGQIELRRKAFLINRERYDQEIEQGKKMHEEFLELQDSYCALCRILGEEAKAYVFDAEQVYAAIAALKEEIEKKKDRLAQRRAAEYVARSINEVMLELGYDIIATDFIKKTKRSIIHHIYEFDNDNVVNVYASDNGSLMFEVSGVHEGQKDLREDEKEQIKDTMVTFCEKYPLLRERMIAKGIKLNFEDIKPADVQYARIVDLSGKKQVKGREGRRRKSEKGREARQKRL